MLELVDGFLLYQAQKLCDWFTVSTSQTKFRLEMLMIFIETAFYLAFAIKASSAIVFFMAAAVVMDNLSSINKTKVKEKEFLKHNKLLVCDKYVNRAWFRCLTLVPPTLVGIIGITVSLPLVAIFFMFWSVTFAIRAYVSACMPSPPGKNKLQIVM